MLYTKERNQRRKKFVQIASNRDGYLQGKSFYKKKNRIIQTILVAVKIK